MPGALSRSEFAPLWPRDSRAILAPVRVGRLSVHRLTWLESTNRARVAPVTEEVGFAIPGAVLGGLPPPALRPLTSGKQTPSEIAPDVGL